MRTTSVSVVRNSGARNAELAALTPGPIAHTEPPIPASPIAPVPARPTALGFQVSKTCDADLEPCGFSSASVGRAFASTAAKITMSTKIAAIMCIHPLN
jgi:hypothetical protein